MTTFLDWFFSERGPTILAGALGGVVRWVTLQETWRAGLASIVVGAICSLYLTPLVLPMLTPMIGPFIGDEANRVGFSGFIIGLAGITISGFFIDFFRKWSKEKLGEDHKA